MKKLVAIGGGENGRVLDNGTKTLYETKKIDKEIVKLTGKDNPNFLFICHAMSFSTQIEESYYEVMKGIYEDLGCSCNILKSTDLCNRKIVEELINWADIIYEGGGDTQVMINLWNETGFDNVLKKACDDGKVICGISAGAVCWFNACNSDTEEGFEVVDCLDWIDFFITPHADEDGRYESTKKQLKENGKIGLMLSNCSAIEIIDNKYKIITEECNNRKFSKRYVMKCFWEDDIFKEEILTENNQLENLDKLFNKNINGSVNIIEYEDKYLEDVKDLLVELEEYIITIDGDNLDCLHPEYREKMAILDLEEVKRLSGKCYLALEHDKVIGLIMGYVREYDAFDYLDYKCPKSGEISELIISKEERDSGLGKILIKRMEDYFKSIGCEYVLVDCFAYNRNGQRFYEKNGYHPRMYTNIKCLKENL